MRTFRRVLKGLNSESEEENIENFEDEAPELNFKNSRVNSRAQ